MKFRARGHASIAGSHDKTLEFTRDADVSRRATCVLGVGSDHDDAQLRALRGDVAVTITCGGVSDSFTATVTPFFVGDDSLIFRTGAELRGRTLAYDATKSAADIDRDLVRALANPTAEVEVEIEELGSGARHGVLFVVAVPIGNDDDLSPRARRVLESADVVLAEDTRRFRDLAQRTGIAVDASVLSYHDHNEAERTPDVIERLRGGARVALVSDAGTPLCSDPGYVVVRTAVDEHLPVSPVPGPSSLLAVLSASGLAVDRFTYVAFLSRRAAARQSELRELVDRGDTFVLHEAPHRVVALLRDLDAVAPEWSICAGREVTKVFEEFLRGTASSLLATLTAEEPRGEFTLVVAPPGRRDRARVAGVVDDDVERVLRALARQGVTTKTLAAALAELPGVSRKAAYERALTIARDA